MFDMYESTKESAQRLALVQRDECATRPTLLLIYKEGTRDKRLKPNTLYVANPRLLQAQ